MNQLVAVDLRATVAFPACSEVEEHPCPRNFVASAGGKQSFADKCVPKCNLGTRGHYRSNFVNRMDASSGFIGQAFIQGCQQGRVVFIRLRHGGEQLRHEKIAILLI